MVSVKRLQNLHIDEAEPRLSGLFFQARLPSFNLSFEVRFIAQHCGFLYFLP